MIIQALLIGGLLLCVFYALTHKQQSRFLSGAILLVAIIGMYLVLFPERTNEVAHFVGVGRGADLILYCWLIISMIISLNLRLQILGLQGLITDLAREMALKGVRHHDDTEGRTR
jgi:small membrane protein